MPSILTLTSLLISFQTSISYFSPEPNAAFCPLVDFRSNALSMYDKNFPVPKSDSVDVITECSLACFQNTPCRGFTFDKNLSNCTLHYSVPYLPFSPLIQQVVVTAPRLMSYVIEGFSIYSYRYPYPCLLPFTLSGSLYNFSCAPVLPRYSKCNYYVCPVKIGNVIEIKQCSSPDNVTQAKASISPIVCLQKEIKVFFLETGRSWILIHHRKMQKSYFLLYSESSRNWTEFKFGFGTPEGDYWIGNDYLYGLTSNQCMPSNGYVNYRLRIEMSDVAGRWYSVEYKYFNVGSEEDNYRLNLTGYDEQFSDLPDAFGLADQPATSTQSGINSRASAPWSVWNCTLPCKIIGFYTNDTHPYGNCTLPTGWWYNSTQLSCRSSMVVGNLNLPYYVWPNKKGFSSYFYPIESRMYITKA